MKEFFKVAELLTYMAGAAAFILSAVIACYFVSCLQQHETQREPRPAPKPVKPWRVSRVERDLVDIEHNGHKFLVLSGYREYSILHAPYCQCKEKANEQ